MGKKAKPFFKAIWKDKSGATAIEYGLIVGIMAALLIAALGTYSDNLEDLFKAITDQLSSLTDQINNPTQN